MENLCGFNVKLLINDSLRTPAREQISLNIYSMLDKYLRMTDKAQNKYKKCRINQGMSTPAKGRTLQLYIAK